MSRSSSIAPSVFEPLLAGCSSSVSRSSFVPIDREIGETIGEGGRQSRPNENPVLAIFTLEVTSNLVKLGKALTGLKGDEQLNLREALRDRGRDPRAQLLQPLPRLGGDKRCLGMPERQLAALLGIQEIDLVHHQQPRGGIGTDLAKNGVRGGDRGRPLLLRLRAIYDVQDHVGEDRCLQGGLERLDEGMRKLADETDGVG